MSATTRTTTTHRAEAGKRRRTSAPRLSPVARAVRSQISWTAYIRGRLAGADHSIPIPSPAPAWE